MCVCTAEKEVKQLENVAKHCVGILHYFTLSILAGPCRDLWRGRCSKYKRGTWNTAFNRAVLLADMCIEMDASVLIQQQMP